MNTVKQQHTHFNGNIDTETKSTYRSLSAQRLSERTVFIGSQTISKESNAEA
jgi:hypothetical protein